jgi:hypothetical protein
MVHKGVRRVCFFIYIPLTDRDYARYGIDKLKRRGLEVSVLDMTRVINPEYLKNYAPAELSAYEGIFTAYSRRDIVNYLRDNRGILGIDMMRLNPFNSFFYRALKRYGIRFIRFYSNKAPSPSADGMGARLIGVLGRIRRGSLKQELPGIWRKAAFLLEKYYCQPPDFLIAGGGRDLSLLSADEKKAGIIWAHALDYDIYLSFLQKEGQVSQQPYCLFLDGYLTCPLDLYTSVLRGGLRDSEIFSNPERYYSGLRGFFSYLEDKLKIKVVIAAHPRSRYDLHGDYFGGRTVAKGRTAELVSGAEFVLAQLSTAVNFAVLYKKPIIFLTSQVLEKSLYGSQIYSLARYFGKAPVDLDRGLCVNFDSEFTVNQAIYDQYRCDYIKSPGSIDKPFWEIVADQIDKINLA